MSVQLALEARPAPPLMGVKKRELGAKATMSASMKRRAGLRAGTKKDLEH